MSITAEQVKSIRQELDKLRPASALSGNRELSVKQTIFALARTLERMKKRGFDLSDISAKLAEKGIEVRSQTLTKYLAEARRQKDMRKTKRLATGPHCSAPKLACRTAGPLDADTPRQTSALSGTEVHEAAGILEKDDGEANSR